MNLKKITLTLMLAALGSQHLGAMKRKQPRQDDRAPKRQRIASESNDTKLITIVCADLEKIHNVPCSIMCQAKELKAKIDGLGGTNHILHNTEILVLDVSKKTMLMLINYITIIQAKLDEKISEQEIAARLSDEFRVALDNHELSMADIQVLYHATGLLKCTLVHTALSSFFNTLQNSHNALVQNYGSLNPTIFQPAINTINPATGQTLSGNLTHAFSTDYQGMHAPDSRQENHNQKATVSKKSLPKNNDRYPCPEQGCPFGFDHEYQLKKHMKTHTKEELYECEKNGCNKSFPSISGLNAHLRNAHKMTEEQIKQFPCTISSCKKAYPTQKVLDMHIQEKHLHKQHKKRTHHADQTRESLYKCEKNGCNKSFPSISGLNAHLRNVHNMTPEQTKQFPCTFGACKQAYPTQKVLDMHIEKKHTNKQRRNRAAQNSNFEPLTQSAVSYNMPAYVPRFTTTRSGLVQSVMTQSQPYTMMQQPTNLSVVPAQDWLDALTIATDSGVQEDNFDTDFFPDFQLSDSCASNDQTINVPENIVSSPEQVPDQNILCQPSNLSDQVFPTFIHDNSDPLHNDFISNQELFTLFPYDPFSAPAMRLPVVITDSEQIPEKNDLCQATMSPRNQSIESDQNSVQSDKHDEKRFTLVSSDGDEIKNVPYAIIAQSSNLKALADLQDYDNDDDSQQKIDLAHVRADQNLFITQEILVVMLKLMDALQKELDEHADENTISNALISFLFDNDIITADTYQDCIDIALTLGCNPLICNALLEFARYKPELTATPLIDTNASVTHDVQEDNAGHNSEPDNDQTDNDQLDTGSLTQHEIYSIDRALDDTGIDVRDQEIMNESSLDSETVAYFVAHNSEQVLIAVDTQTVALVDAIILDNNELERKDVDESSSDSDTIPYQLDNHYDAGPVIIEEIKTIVSVDQDPAISTQLDSNHASDKDSDESSHDEFVPEKKSKQSKKSVSRKTKAPSTTKKGSSNATKSNKRKRTDDDSSEQDAPAKKVAKGQKGQDASKKGKRFACEFEGCGKSFTTPSLLDIHTRSHTGEKPFKCTHEGCNKAYTQSGNLERHERTHTEEKPFKCTHGGCNKAFSRSDLLTLHKRVHTGEKPYKCPYEGCDKAYAQSGDLAKHEKIHTSNKTFKCNYPGCNFAAAIKINLTSHKRTHTEEKPFKCTHDGCDYKSANHGDLNRHMKIHSGQKPFKCTHDGCDYATLRKKDLTTHKRIHTGEKPFTCSYPDCNYSSAIRGNLTRHMKTHNKKR